MGTKGKEDVYESAESYRSVVQEQEGNKHGHQAKQSGTVAMEHQRHTLGVSHLRLFFFRVDANGVAHHLTEACEWCRTRTEHVFS